MKSLAYLIFLILPALNAQQGSTSSASSSVAKEATLGAQLASNFGRENDIIDNAQVNGYVKSTGEKLLKQIPETGFSFHFAAFVDSEKTATHEPRVLPGAYIYVPESLILAARDEAEFAGMLAHAIAHAANRDATRQASRGMPSGLLASPMGGSTLENMVRQNAETTAAVLSLQFQRWYEQEADSRAVPMMAAAGWDPRAFARYIEREQPEVAGTERVFSPLPPRDERVAAVRKLISDLRPQNYSTSAEFAGIQAEVRRLSAGRTQRTVTPVVNPPRGK